MTLSPPSLTWTDRGILAAWWLGPLAVIFAIAPTASLLLSAPTGPAPPPPDTAALAERLSAELVDGGTAELSVAELDLLGQALAARSDSIDHVEVSAAGPDALRVAFGVVRRDGLRQHPFELELTGLAIDGWVHDLEIHSLRVHGWSLGPALALVDPVHEANRKLYDFRYKDAALARALDRVEAVHVDQTGVEIRLSPGGWALWETWRALPGDHWEPPTGEGLRRPPSPEELER